MAAPAIDFQGVHKRYRVYRQRYSSLKEILVHRRLGEWEDRWALNGVSFQVAEGETLGLVGPNGAGKSTALKLMARILEPDSGRVAVRGRVAALIELGAGFLLEYTGRENVYLNASLLGMTRRQIDASFDSIVAFAELGDHIESPLRTYSSGMYMRLGFSIAIHAEPEVMLIDEILAVGDEAFQHRCLDWIDGFRQRGGTIVLISHNLAAVREMCGRVGWIEHGELQALGDPDEVVDAYLDAVREREAAGQPGAAGRPEPGSAGRSIELGEARLLDGRGRPVHDLRSGETLLIEIPYLARRRLQPVFGVQIHRNDGAYVYGTNSTVGSPAIGPVSGPGRVGLRLPNLSLLGGTYRVTVAVFTDSRANASPVDAHEQRYAFRVTSRTREQGLARLDHRWEVLEDTGLDRPSASSA